MITEEEYLKAKLVVDEYEAMEIQQATIEAMYCVECQAFEEHDCFCEEDGKLYQTCDYCSYNFGEHAVSCIYNESPYDMLLRDGYD